LQWETGDVDLTERHSRGDLSATSLEKPLDNVAPHQNSPSKDGDSTIAPSRSKPLRRRGISKARNSEKQLGIANLRTSIFQSTAELISAKGYNVIPSPLAGIDLIASKLVELPGYGFVADVLPFRFHQEPGLIKIGDKSDGSIRVMKGENESIDTLSNELIRNAIRLISAVSEGDGSAEESADYHVINALVEGLETYSVNLLLGKLNYTRLKGKEIGFWVNPVLLTSSHLENESGESKSWVPVPTRLRGLDFDVVGITHLASYLDLREKEVKILGRQVLKGKRGLGDFPRQLRIFRLLTSSAALILIVTFLILASNLVAGFPAAQSGLGLAMMIEAFGGWRLFRSYRRLQRNNNTRIHSGSQLVTAEHVVMNEGAFARDEIPYLHAKYGGAELSKLRKGLRTQRISELVRKAEDLLNKAGELENENLYSEAILSAERATRSALNAALLSMGIEGQARDTDQWVPSLKNILQKEKLEDLRCIMDLRDKINGGYDASHREVEKIKEKAKPIIGSVVDYLRNSFKGGDPQIKLSVVEPPLSDLRVDSQTKKNLYSGRSRNRHGPQEIEESEPRIPNEVLNTTQSLKFLLNVADDKELLNLGSAGDYLVKAKKTLETNTDNQSKPTELPRTDSAKISEELDSLAKSLTSPLVESKMARGGNQDSSDAHSDEVAAPDRILPFEHLADFRKVITQCQLPLVASFLSDDEISKEVENVMKSLVAKYHARAAFITVHSESEDIARECKIKSYPTILVFHAGKVLGELKLANVEQLEKDLLKVVEPAASDDREQTYHHRVHLTASESKKVTTTKWTGEQSDEIVQGEVKD